MHFGYSLLYVLVVAGSAAIVEFVARGMRWLGLDDISYYILSGLRTLSCSWTRCCSWPCVALQRENYGGVQHMNTHEDESFARRMFRKACGVFLRP
jgi:hypothetical protein